MAAQPNSMSQQLLAMSKDELVTEVQRIVDVWCEDDSTTQSDPRPVVEKYFAPDAVYEDASFPLRRKHTGYDEICEGILAGFEGLCNWKFYITNAFTDGKWIAMEWYWTGTHKGKAAMGVPPTGKNFNIRGSTWVSINEEGKLTYSIDYYDRMTLMHQIWHEEPGEVPSDYRVF
jgi:predicted ester cyclase